jgi:hypothetical protein
MPLAVSLSWGFANKPADVSGSARSNICRAMRRRRESRANSPRNMRRARSHGQHVK